MKLNEIEEPTFEEKMKVIERECSEIMEIYKQTVTMQNNFRCLWRGTKNPTFKKTIKSRERTHAVPKQLHEFWHDVFLNLGYEATRKNGIFTTPNFNVAKEWGTPQIVFPKDGFKYTWFRGQKSRYSLQYLDSLILFLVKHIVPYIQEKGEKNDSVLKKPEKYFDYILENYPELKNRIYEEAKNILKNDLIIKNTELKTAITTSNEVLITDSEYFALNDSEFYSFISYLNDEEK